MNALARRQWFNVGLCLVAGALATLVWFEADRDRSAGMPPLLDLTPARIGRITVERSGQPSLAFERREGLWWMIAPATGPANPTLLEPIQQLAATRCDLQYAAAALDPKVLQLEPPKLRLRLDDREIRFGATAPTDGQRYLQIGATVHLCPDKLYRLLTSAAESFLAPSIEALLMKAKDGK